MELSDVISALILFLCLLNLVIFHYVKSSCASQCEKICANVSLTPQLRDLLYRALSNSSKYVNISIGGDAIAIGIHENRTDEGS